VCGSQGYGWLGGVLDGVCQGLCGCGWGGLGAWSRVKLTRDCVRDCVAIASQVLPGGCSLALLPCIPGGLGVGVEIGLRLSGILLRHCALCVGGCEGGCAWMCVTGARGD